MGYVFTKQEEQWETVEDEVFFEVEEDEDEELSTIDSMIAEYDELDIQISLLTKKRDSIKTDLLLLMGVEGMKKHQFNGLTVSYIEATEKVKFDEKAFQEANPVEFSKWKKTSTTKAHIKFTRAKK